MWDNGAAVHCVIVGFSDSPKPKKRPLWFFPNVKGEPDLVWVENINPYLINAPDVLVRSRSRPLQPSTQKMVYGSKPTDDGLLSNISAPEAAEIKKSDPIAGKYLRRIMGARELLHNEERWCVWLVGADPSDIRKSPELSRRVIGVRNFRLNSTDRMTLADAEKPAEFQRIRQPLTNYIAVPRHSSEARDYVPMALCQQDLIAGDSLQTIPNGNLRTFGVLMSRTFNLWNKTVSGRLKSDTRISGTTTYNNFPFPDTDSVQDKQIEEASQQVLNARAKFPNSSLADLYDSNAMPSDLRKAHQQLDKVVMAAFGLKASASDEEILSDLFRRYEEATKLLI
jgi:hypothetical protein